MNNSNNDDDLFSGMALKNKKTISFKKEQSIKPNIPDPSNNFELDFLNSLVNKGISKNNNSNNNKYTFPNESLFSSLNNFDYTNKNNSKEIISSHTINTKNQEYSFLNKKQPNNSLDLDKNNEKSNKLKEFEESLKETELSSTNVNKKEEIQSSLNRENYSMKVFPGENGEYTLSSIKEQYEKYISSNEENLIKIYLRLIELNNINSQKQDYCKELEIKLAELLNNENQAIEQNDFEEAQRLEISYNNTKTLIEECKKDNKINKKEVIFLRDQEVILIKNFLNINDSFINSIESEAENERDLLTKITTEELEKNSNELRDILKIRDGLNSKKEELVNDISDIDSLQEKIDRAINLQSNEIKSKLDEFSCSRKRLIDEIEEINLTLSNKYKELDSLNTNIKQREIELETIKSNFDPELRKIENMIKEYQEKENKIKTQENNIEIQIKNLNNNDVLLKNKQVILQRNQENFEKILKELEEEKEKFNINYKKISDFVEKEKEYSKKTDTIELERTTLQEIIEKNNLEIEKLEKSIRFYNSEIISNDLKIPNLEHEKKLQVMSKNFKQAGKISNDLKALQEMKSEYFSKIETESQKIIEIKQSNQNTEEKVEEQEIEIDKLSQTFVKEKNQYLLTFRNILLQIFNKNSLILSENHKLQLVNELSSINDQLENCVKISRIQEKIDENKSDINIKVENDLQNQLVNDSLPLSNDKAIYFFNKKKLDENILTEDEINILKLEIAQDIELVREKSDPLML